MRRMRNFMTYRLGWDRLLRQVSKVVGHGKSERSQLEVGYLKVCTTKERGLDSDRIDCDHVTIHASWPWRMKHSCSFCIGAVAF